MFTYNSTIHTPLLSGEVDSCLRHQTLSKLQFKQNGIRNEEQNFTSKRLSWKDLFPQVMASVIAFMLVTQPGVNMVYSNIFLKHYAFTEVSELSWLTSILVMCTPVGVIVIGLIMDRVGRKNAFILTCVPLLISWSIASVARPENMGLIYACRFFAGIGGGMTSMVVVYVSEIAHSTYRQALLSLNSVFFSAGVLFATAVGSAFQWQAVNVIFFAFTAVTTGLLVVFLPESPVWIAKFRSDRPYEARRSLKSLYPGNEQVLAEEWDRLHYDRPIQPVDDDDDGRHVRALRSRPGLWNSAGRPATVTGPVRVLAVVFLLQQLSGCYPVLFYAVPIVRTVLGASADSAGVPTQMDTLIVLGTVRLLASTAACALSLHVGRRPLMIASSLAMACSAALVALTCPPTAAAAAAADEYDAAEYSAAEYDAPAPPPTPLLSLFGVAAFACSGSAGVLVIPWTLVGELLPVSVRATAGAALVSYAYLLMFVVLQAFPHVVSLDERVVVGGGRGVPVAVAFAGFAAASLAMAAYVHARLPETLAKPFHEVEQHFSVDARPPRSPSSTAKA